MGAARKLHLTRGTEVVGETTAAELRARVLASPIVRELQPDARPKHVFCPCGKRLDVAPKGRIPRFCDGEGCKPRWSCQRCGSRLSDDAKEAAIRAGKSETPCEVVDCKALATWRQQTVCAGWEGPCPENKQVPAHAFQQCRILRRSVEWRCRVCAQRKRYQESTATQKAAMYSALRRGWQDARHEIAQSNQTRMLHRWAKIAASGSPLPSGTKKRLPCDVCGTPSVYRPSAYKRSRPYCSKHPRGRTREKSS